MKKKQQQKTDHLFIRHNEKDAGEYDGLRTLHNKSTTQAIYNSKPASTLSRTRCHLLPNKAKT